MRRLAAAQVATRPATSATGTKRTSGNARPMTAFGGEADIPAQGRDFRKLTRRGHCGTGEGLLAVWGALSNDEVRPIGALERTH